MFIKEILEKKKESLSFEVFPPKEGSAYEPIEKAIGELSLLNPDFISVTYGAGGGTSKNTVKIASDIQNKYNITSIAHLTCVSSTKAEVLEIIKNLKQNNIKNILALRGDIPEGSGFPSPKYYHYAYELINEIKKHGDFCIGAACYPEGHIECTSLDKDIDNLKNKVDCGCDFLITQLFFDNNFLYNFMDKLIKKNITVPVLAGIMPVTNIKQIERICYLSGASIPPELDLILKKYSDKDDILKAGLNYAEEQIIDLIKNDFVKIHIYSMNKADISKRLSSIAINSMQKNNKSS